MKHNQNNRKTTFFYQKALITAPSLTGPYKCVDFLQEGEEIARKIYKERYTPVTTIHEGIDLVENSKAMAVAVGNTIMDDYLQGSCDLVKIPGLYMIGALSMITQKAFAFTEVLHNL